MTVVLFFFLSCCSYINGVAEAAKKSPELIQLLELHTQFASITPYAQVKTQVPLLDSSFLHQN